VPRTTAPLRVPEVTPPPWTVSHLASDAALDGVVRPSGNGEQPGGGTGDLFVAVVHTADNVRLVAASSSREELVRQLAEHVRRCAPDELWAEDAAHVCALVSGGDLQAAITQYFAAVGQRWDKEWLVTAKVRASGLAVGAPAEKGVGAGRRR
jgi:hypothetical protein